MSKDIKKALEHCVEWKCDNCPNGDDLGSGETVCRGRLLPQVLEYVADLEAKLAESEELTERLQQIVNKLRDKEFAGSTLVDAIINVYEPIYKVKFDECEQLKQQLAEKEKELLEIKQRIAEKASKEFQEMIDKRENHNQDKISFAVEQLDNILNLIEEEIDSQRKTTQPFDNDKIIDLVFRQLNKQIKELKEMK